MGVLLILLYFLVGVLVAGLNLRFANPESYDGNEMPYSLIIVVGYPILIVMAVLKIICGWLFVVISFIGGKK